MQRPARLFRTHMCRRRRVCLCVWCDDPVKRRPSLQRAVRLHGRCYVMVGWTLCRLQLCTEGDTETNGHVRRRQLALLLPPLLSFGPQTIGATVAKYTVYHTHANSYTPYHTVPCRNTT
ncbi:hypothetical protein NDU88_004561 [Pleurodeles waltl]|uniref:Secreted protein n=1 Tax=Pleurodeles waltl TaxID=8319 RepID=A0AAV7QIT6_PLEWA|nr:hypothetical protein NDU88_004561 [Pleurodeles waltl]